VPAALAEERRQWMRDMIRGMGGQIEADVEIPATMPAYGSFLIDAEGNLWVEEYRIRGEQPSWAVFNPDGRFLGTVDVPADGEIFEIGSDYVLGVWLDEADVEQVKSYGLEKS
jgi:sugar lactone lactonase YvrE